MTTFDFSVARRAPNLVDIVVPKQVGADSFRFEASPTFDGSFVALFTMPYGRGYLDPSLNNPQSRSRLHTQPGINKVRAVFDPNTFTGTASIVDTGQFWLQMYPILGGGDGTPTPPVLVLHPGQHNGEARIVFSGNSPTAADISGSLQLCLPRRAMDIHISHQDATNPLFVAFSATGDEVEISDTNSPYIFKDGFDSNLFVRSTGGAVTFSVDFTVSSIF